MKVNKIKIILRLCSSVMHYNAPRQMQEYGIFEKLDVIKRTAGPLYAALRQYVDTTKKTVEVIGILDNCSANVESVHAHFVNQFRIPLTIEKYSNQVGNAGTFRRQCEIAKTCEKSDLAFFLEDDYLIVNPEMFIVIDRLFEIYDVDGINPHWHPKCAATRNGSVVEPLDVHGVKFGRVYDSCCTFVVNSQVFKDNESVFLRYCDRCRENDSFNNVWREKRFYGVCDGTMMEHLHKCDLSGVFDLGAYKRK